MVQESNSVPILGKREPSLAQKKLDRTRAILAVLMMVGIFSCMMASVSTISDYLHRHPQLHFLFPLFGAGSVLSILPLGVYLSYQDDFPDVNPIIPTHYLYLAKRCFIALVENNGKVTGKDL